MFIWFFVFHFSSFLVEVVVSRLLLYADHWICLQRTAMVYRVQYSAVQRTVYAIQLHASLPHREEFHKFLFLPTSRAMAIQVIALTAAVDPEALINPAVLGPTYLHYYRYLVPNAGLSPDRIFLITRPANSY